MRMNLKKYISVVVLILSIAVLAGCTAESGTSDKISEISTGTSHNIELIISAAASLKDVGAEIAKIYKQKVPNVKITYNFGSSGSLQTQIEEGAPSDIFISAAQKQMAALKEKGLVINDTNKDLLSNKIVLITPKDSKKEITKFEDISTDKVSKVALGEPGSVPVGQYSEEVFTKLGILDKVKPKSNYGSDVRQVLTWVENGEVDCGVVYATDAAASQKVNVVCEALKDSNKPIIYPVAVLKSSKHYNEAKAFVDFLSSSEAVKVFEKYGFSMNK
jgi:molybdate transport system substrate-binding protein